MQNIISRQVSLWLAALLAVATIFFGFVPLTYAANGDSTLNAIFSDVNGCQLSSTTVHVTGNATGVTPPGLIGQYHVQIDWGDGNTDDQTEVAPFGAEDPSTRNFAGAHNYTTPGNYTIVAKIYHQNPNGQDNPAVSQASIQICIVSPLTISKTANTSLNRTWTWGIDKTADQTNLLLADGELFTVNYGVTASASSLDSAWNVGGNISITNPVGNPVITVTVTDTLATDGAAPVVCPQNSIAPGATLVCTYAKSLPAANNQLNTANVVASEAVLNGSATANVNFANATINKVDECATVTDTNAQGPQGVVKCAGVDILPAVWNYSVSFGKNANAQVHLVCGVNPAYNNTASFVTNDSATAGQDSWNVNATVTCVVAQGCTLTQGYWKTHNDSFKGGAPTDDNWANLSGLKELTAFYTSGKTWFALFWTPPAGGNVYIQLAHQYMAAKLNVLNGAGTPPAVAAAIAGAEGWFPGKTPATSLTNAQKNQAKGWASTLGAYNEGKLGVQHCSE